METIDYSIETAIEYEIHKCYSAYTIIRSAFEQVEQLETILSDMSSEN